jgi:RHS repeat-associated protein
VDGYNFASLDYYDTSTTTVLAPFRVFSPNIGRWHSPDPLGGDVTNPQSLNRYAYVANNPTTSIDPLGLDPCTNANTGPGGSYACTPEQAAQTNLWGGGGGGGLGNYDPFSLLYLQEATMDREMAAGSVEGEDVYVNFGALSLIGANNGTTSNCTVTNGRTTAVSAQQPAANRSGAFGFVAPVGSVAVDPWALGLFPGHSHETNDVLAPYTSQITFRFSPVPNLPAGFPTSYTLGDILGGPTRFGHSDFNGLFDFDIYTLPSTAAANTATSEAGVAVAVTVTYPSSLPINCGGPIADPVPLPVMAIEPRP